MSFDMPRDDDPHGECRHEIHRVTAERDKLQKQLTDAEEELKLWKPMTYEEAEAAIDAAEAVPISQERIEQIVAQVTDPTYRPTEAEHVQLAVKVKLLRLQVDMLRASLQESNEWRERLQEAERLLRLVCEKVVGTPVVEQSSELADIALAIEAHDAEQHRDIEYRHLATNQVLQQKLAAVSAKLQEIVCTDERNYGAVRWTPTGQELIELWEMCQ